MNPMTRRELLQSAAVALTAAAFPFAAAPALAGSNVLTGTSATVYKSPTCGCCNGYVSYLRVRGVEVATHQRDDMSRVKRYFGVPRTLESCHTMVIGDYVVEGHVPAETLRRLLDERPDIKGIALPNMPQGSPGMSGARTAPFVIFSFGPGGTRVWDTL